MYPRWQHRPWGGLPHFRSHIFQKFFVYFWKYRSQERFLKFVQNKQKCFVPGYAILTGSKRYELNIQLLEQKSTFRVKNNSKLNKYSHEKRCVRWGLFVNKRVFIHIQIIEPKSTFISKKTTLNRASNPAKVAQPGTKHLCVS